MAIADDYANWIVNHPDRKGTPEFDTVVAAYKEALASQPNAQQKPPQAPAKAYTPPSVTDGMSTTEKLLAGAGKAFVDVGRGVGQLVGQVNPQEIDDAKKLDAPLMDTKAGIAGNVLGNIAAFSPSILVPGANTVLGGAALGGLSGALQPTGTNDNRLENIALGAGIGGTANKLAQVVSNTVGAARSAQAVKQSQNSTRDATLKAAQEAGYVVPPTTTSPTWLNRNLESIAGKAQTQQGAVVNNAQVTDDLARKYLGLPEDTAFSPSLIDQLLIERSGPYKEAAKLPSALKVGVNSEPSQSGAQLVEAIKTARDDSRAAWKSFNSGNAQNPTELRQQAQAADDLVAKYESQLEDLATKKGSPDLVDALRQSRIDLAKVHSVDRAMNEGSGSINAKNFASQWNNNVPLTGEAKVIADFANTFPKVTGPIESIGSPEVSKTKWLASLLLSGGGAAATGGPGAIAGILPFVAPDVAKKILLSGTMQNTPKYGVGPTKALAEALLASRYSPMAITGATIPALSK